jgi:UDP-glucose 4-epimerase
MVTDDAFSSAPERVNVLVTGVSRYLGASLAARLAEHPRVARVVGVDTTAPSPAMARLLGDRVDVLTIDTRELIGVVADTGVDAVAHMGVLSSPGRAGRQAMK